MTEEETSSEIECASPAGMLEIRTWAMPADTNPAGDIFGGWLLSQMDIAGALTARRVSQGRTATVAVDAMEFHQPVYVGDILCCYTDVEKIGNTSMRIKIEAWATRSGMGAQVKVTEGTFTYVSIDENRKPRAVENRK